MFRILTCIAVEHDLRLVLLAALICFLSSYVAVTLAQRAAISEGMARALWLGAAGTSSGFGIWATHFIAMVAYDAGVVVGYDMKLTLVSLAVAIVVTSIGLAIATYRSGRGALVAGGIVLGAGISSMHYIGMSAMVAPADMQWACRRWSFPAPSAGRPAMWPCRLSLPASSARYRSSPACARSRVRATGPLPPR